MPKNVSFYSNAVANVFIRHGYGNLVTFFEEVCHGMFAQNFFFFFLNKEGPVRTHRLELQCTCFIRGYY